MSIKNLQASLICYHLAFIISTLNCSWGKKDVILNNAVCAGKVGVAIVRTKKNKHKKSTIITIMLPFDF
jgi:hypothetical protein